MTAKKDAAPAAAEATEETSSGQGKAIVLPNGQKRIEYIRDQYYNEGAKRGDIARALTEMQGKTIPYQIVFAATKEKEDPRIAAAAAKAAKEKEKQEAAEAAAKAAETAAK